MAGHSWFERKNGTVDTKPFRKPAPLIEISGRQEYILYRLEKKGTGKTLYYAMRLNRDDANDLRELDRRLKDSRYDPGKVHEERKQFISKRTDSLRKFVAPTGKYGFGFMPAADALKLAEGRM